MNEKIFPEIKILKLKFIVKAEEEMILPGYKGSTFRGAFGVAFKRAVCIMHNRNNCDECMIAKNCIYLNIFETPLILEISKEVLDFLKISKIEKLPHPFIIEPPKDTKNVYKKDDLLSFDMILMGNTMQYYPYFVHSVSELGNIGIGKGRSRFEIMEIQVYENLSKSINIFDKERNRLFDFKNDFILNKNNYTLDSKLNLKFITPVRIKSMSKYLTEIAFQNIIVNLIRRIFTILVFHYNYKMDTDLISSARKLIDDSAKIETISSSLEWFEWERWSNRQDTRMSLGGLMGEISFQGDLKEFSEIINIGQYLHLGKATAFGLGEYKIFD